MEIGQVLVRLEADVAGLRSGMEKAIRHIEDVGRAAKRTEDSSGNSFKGMIASATKLGAAIGISLGTAQIVRFGLQVVDLGGRLTDLAQRVDISTATLSGYKSTLEENGASVEGFATAIYMAQKNLGEITKETDPAAQALKRLGLQLDQVRNQDTEEFMDDLIKRLAAIQNPMERNAIGAAILGRQYRDLAPAITALAANMEQLKRSGMSEADIAALDAAGDAWTAFGNKVTIVTGRFLRFAMDEIEVFKRDLQRFANFLKSFTSAQNFQDFWSGKNQVFVPPKGNLGDLSGGLDKMGGGEFKGFGDASKIEAQKKALDGFFDSLRKQAQALQVSNTEMNEGSEAARKMALQFEVANFKAQMLRDGMKLPAGFDAQVKKISDEIGVWADKLADAQRKEKQFNDELQRLQGIAREGDAALNNLNNILGKIAENSLTDEEKLTKPFYDMKLAVLQVQDQLIALGALAPEVADQISGALGRIDAQIARAQIKDSEMKLGGDAEGVKQAQEQYAKLRIEFDQLTGVSQLLHGNFDLLGNQISTQRQLLDAAIEGYGLFSRQAQEAADQLLHLQQVAQNQQALLTLVDSLTAGIDQTLAGIIQGSQTLEEGMKNLARNMLLSFMNEFNKLAIINPIKNWLSEMITGAQGTRLPTLGTLFATGITANAAGGTPSLEADWGNRAADAFQQMNTAVESGLSSLSNIGQTGFGQFFISLGSTIMQGLQGLGQGISSGASGIGSWFSSIFSGIGSMFSFAHSGAEVRRGGLVNVSAGETILNPYHARLNRTAPMLSSMPNQNVTVQSQPIVQIMGDVLSRRDIATKKDVVHIMTRDADERGPVTRTMEKRMSKNSGLGN